MPMPAFGIVEGAVYTRPSFARRFQHYERCNLLVVDWMFLRQCAAFIAGVSWSKWKLSGLSGNWKEPKCVCFRLNHCLKHILVKSSRIGNVWPSSAMCSASKITLSSLFS
jgi:hypothetical protein